MNKAYFKTTIREIKNSFGRYIAILAICFLGVGFFTGLKMTRPSMVYSVNKYLENANFFDFRLVSTLGFDELTDGNANLLDDYIAEGAISADALVTVDGSDEVVFKFHSMPETINKLVLVSGRLPESEDECVIDAKYYKDIDNSGAAPIVTVTLENDEDTLDMFRTKEFKIVGTVNSPLYMLFERGTTSIGNGKVTGFIYINKDAFDCDYLTEIYVKTAAYYTIYSDAYNDYIDNIQDEMEDKAKKLANARYDRIVGEAQEKVDDAEKELNEKKADGEKELEDARIKLVDAEKEIKEHEEEIEDGRAQLDDAKKKISENVHELAEKESQLKEMQSFMLPEQYDEAMRQITSGWIRIASAKDEISDKEKELTDGEKELEDAKKEVADGWEEYYDGLKTLKDEVSDAEQKLDDAKSEIADIEKPDTYALNRNTNIGYVCFENDSNIVAGIANVFPLFFFLVAALIIMTTMNRMVEDQRTQIGILKALGYSNSAIIFKYNFYAGSAALVGAVLGYSIGRRVFPTTIFAAYKIMYTVGDITPMLDPVLAVIVTLIALLTAVGTTYFTCRYELISAPANLIRPKAPKGGKRIFLEYITFIWNRMKFLRKVSMRNLFRYKKRFFMMVLGISGCTALLITGFGLKDSIMDIANMQYEEVQVYDASINFTDPLDSDKQASFVNETDNLFENVAFCYEESVDIDFKGKTKTIYLEVPQEPDDFCSFVHLMTKDDEAIPYPGKGEAVITSKIAETLGINVGDSVILRDNDMQQINVKIAALCKNYVYNYIYISRETYEACIGAEPVYKSAYVKAKDGVDIHSATAAVSDRKDVLSASATKDMQERVNNMMSSMNYIVLLVIFCAGFLAFIVLYNLTNINITERIREIATIKVLGFYAIETADYVFRENLLLTGIGACVGLLLGRWLHWFVMYNINIDMVSFKTFISGKSYIYSLLLTFIFALSVNALMFFKLEKINMAESLKSVE